MDAHPAAREGMDGVMGERRAQQVATDPFEPLPVASVDGRHCMQVHAQRRHGEWWRGRGLGRREHGHHALLAGAGAGK